MGGTPPRGGGRAFGNRAMVACFPEWVSKTIVRRPPFARLPPRTEVRKKAGIALDVYRVVRDKERGGRRGRPRKRRLVWRRTKWSSRKRSSGSRFRRPTCRSWRSWFRGP